MNEVLWNSNKILYETKKHNGKQQNKIKHKSFLVISYLILLFHYIKIKFGCFFEYAFLFPIKVINLIKFNFIIIMLI